MNLVLLSERVVVPQSSYFPWYHPPPALHPPPEQSQTTDHTAHTEHLHGNPTSTVVAVPPWPALAPWRRIRRARPISQHRHQRHRRRRSHHRHRHHHRSAPIAICRPVQVPLRCELRFRWYFTVPSRSEKKIHCTVPSRPVVKICPVDIYRPAPLVEKLLIHCPVPPRQLSFVLIAPSPLNSQSRL